LSEEIFGGGNGLIGYSYHLGLCASTHHVLRRRILNLKKELKGNINLIKIKIAAILRKNGIYFGVKNEDKKWICK